MRLIIISSQNLRTNQVIEVNIMINQDIQIEGRGMEYTIVRHRYVEKIKQN